MSMGSNSSIFFSLIFSISLISSTFVSNSSVPQPAATDKSLLWGTSHYYYFHLFIDLFVRIEMLPKVTNESNRISEMIPRRPTVSGLDRFAGAVCSQSIRVAQNLSFIQQIFQFHARSCSAELMNVSALLRSCAPKHASPRSAYWFSLLRDYKLCHAIRCLLVLLESSAAVTSLQCSRFHLRRASPPCHHIASPHVIDSNGSEIYENGL